MPPKGVKSIGGVPPSQYRRKKHRRAKNGSRKSLKGDGATFNTTAMGLPMMKRSFPDNKPFKFFQTSTILDAFNNSGGATEYDTYFTSAVITQFSSFAALFDQYMISMIEAWILPREHSPVVGSGSTNVGILASVVDYDDANGVGSLAGLQQYENCVTTTATQGHYRKWVPHIATGAFAGTFTAYNNRAKQWIDCASTAVQHYGLKIFVTGADAGTSVTHYDLIYRVHVQFKNVR